MANSVEMCFQSSQASAGHFTSTPAVMVNTEPDLATESSKTPMSGQEVIDLHEMTAVYDSEYGEDDDDESVFTDSALLLSLTRLCKFVVVGFPTIIVLVIIFGSIDGEEKTDFRFRISQVFVSFGIIVLIVVICLSLFRTGMPNLNLFQNPGDEDHTNRLDERQRQREELKLQIKDPWRRKQQNQVRKPYFHHVDLYKQTGLYSKHRY